MTTLAAVLFGATIAVAIFDWIAVGRSQQSLEFVAKPLTMVCLIGAALALDPVSSTARTWFVAALVFSLAGDVFLMLPKDLFVPGLGSFLVGHIAYIVGLRYLDTSVPGFVVGLLIVAAALPFLGTKIIGAIQRSDESELVIPVAVYMTVISVMVVSAGATGLWVALVGAVLFYVSDALIAWTKFITDFAGGRLAVIVTYHVAQISLVLALV